MKIAKMKGDFITAARNVTPSGQFHEYAWTRVDAARPPEDRCDELDLRPMVADNTSCTELLYGRIDLLGHGCDRNIRTRPVYDDPGTDRSRHQAG